MARACVCVCMCVFAYHINLGLEISVRQGRLKNDILGPKETVCGSIAFSACWCLIWKGSRQTHSDKDLICDMHYWQHSWRLNVLSYLL